MKAILSFLLSIMKKYFCKSSPLPKNILYAKNKAIERQITPF